MYVKEFESILSLGLWMVDSIATDLLRHMKPGFQPMWNGMWLGSCGGAWVGVGLCNVVTLSGDGCH